MVLLTVDNNINHKSLIYNSTCSICLDSDTPLDFLTKCGHQFHYKCLVGSIKNECPNCRCQLSPSISYTYEIQRFLKNHNLINLEDLVAISEIKFEVSKPNCSINLSNGMIVSIQN